MTSAVAMNLQNREAANGKRDRREDARMSALWRHLQFLPSRHRLLTSSAEFWFFSARVLVFVMAAAEAVAWGYLGYLFGEGAARWMGAGFAGGIIFLVVWMIDVSLITMDRASREHREALSPQTAERVATKDRWKPARDIFTFGIRISLLIGSLTITAPYLAQVVFHRDIQRFVDAEATTALDAGRRQLADVFDGKLAAKSQQIATQRSALEREVAGKGLSGKYGVGAAARALAAALVNLESEGRELQRQKEKALGDYDALTLDWRNNRDRLASQYHVELPQTSILENRKALEELRQRPENRSTELAIKAFLVFIFAGLLLLKLFEPASVRMYLSEALQQEYNSYLAGTFDEVLPATERHNSENFTMSPQRFYDFLVRVGVPWRRLAEDDKEARERALTASRTLKVLEDSRKQVESELERIKAARGAARKVLEQKAHEMQTWKTAMAVVEAGILNLESNLAGQSTGPDASAELEDEQSRLALAQARLASQSKLRIDLAKARLAMKKLQAREDEYRRGVKLAEDEMEEIRENATAKNKDLALLEKRIRDVRESVATSQARTVVDGSGVSC